MKLDDISIAPSPLTERIYIGTISKRDHSVWNQKRDFTSNFLRALMEWTPPGSIRPFQDNAGNMYELQIKKVENKNDTTV